MLFEQQKKKNAYTLFQQFLSRIVFEFLHKNTAYTPERKKIIDRKISVNRKIAYTLVRYIENIIDDAMPTITRNKCLNCFNHVQGLYQGLYPRIKADNILIFN